MTSRSKKASPAYPVLAAALVQAPAVCGVYLFKDGLGRVLYVGKAVNLKHRLSSYLKTPAKHDPKTALMLKKAAAVDFLITPREREALILERNLIKTHRPRYNVVLRDDKNFLCLRLDLKEDFPALRFVRRFSPDGALYFGPYASAAPARETVKIMKQVFGLRTCKERRLAPRTRPCLDYQMGRCLGPCAGLVSREDYRQAVQDAVQFLRGRGKSLIAGLKKQMAEAAQNLDFERAAALRDRSRAISRTLERQDMAKPSLKDQDVMGATREGGRALVLVLLVRAGLVTGSREYYFPEPPPGDDLLGDFLKQYYSEGRPLPDEVLLPWDLPDRRLLTEILSDQKGKPVRLVVVENGGRKTPDSLPVHGLEEVVEEGRDLRSLALPHFSPKSKRARLMALAQENAGAALRRRERAVSPEDALRDLQERLGLPAPPQRLECLDISTLQGEQPVGALVAFTEGLPDRSGYRRFRIREVEGQDDYAMLGEVVRRHYGKAGQVLPDLLVVDGGKGQLKVVLETLKDLGVPPFPVTALAKARELKGAAVRDRLFLPGRKNPKFLPESAPGWLLLLRLRDEAHRFAITYHRQRARKELTTSVLSRIPGIGPVRQKALLTCYASLEEMQAATLEELAALPGFTGKAAAQLKEWLDSR